MPEEQEREREEKDCARWPVGGGEERRNKRLFCPPSTVRRSVGIEEGGEEGLLVHRQTNNRTVAKPLPSPSFVPFAVVRIPRRL